MSINATEKSGSNNFTESVNRSNFQVGWRLFLKVGSNRGPYRYFLVLILQMRRRRCLQKKKIVYSHIKFVKSPRWVGIVPVS